MGINLIVAGFLHVCLYIYNTNSTSNISENANYYFKKAEIHMLA